MEKLSENLAQGSLSHLSLLVEQSKALKESQTRAVNNLKGSRKLAHLELKLNSLKLKRQHLLNKKRKRSSHSMRIYKEDEYRLTSLKKKLLDQFASQSYNKLKQVNINRVNEEEAKENLMAIIAKKTSGSIKHRKLVNIHNAYRLSGVSLFSIQETGTNFCVKDMIGIRWDASHRGHYMDRYYIIFKVAKAQNENGKGNSTNENRNETKDVVGQKFIIHRHSLPHFVPVTELWKENDFRTYVKRIGSYLNAFVARREQVAELSNKYGCDEIALKEKESESSNVNSSTSSNVSASEAKDTILITGKFLKNICSIRIAYGSLLEVVPSRVTLKLKRQKNEMVVELNNDTSMQLTLLELVEECVELYNRT